MLTFLVLLVLLHVPPAEFRTAWFVESLLTEVAILLVVRTQGPLWRSLPAPALLVSSGVVAVVAVALPYLVFAQELFAFVPLSGGVLGLLLAIAAAYVIANEAVKRVFGRRIHV